MVETAEMLSRLDSMEPAAAAADAAEIKRIMLAAQQVAVRLAAAFAPDVLTGVSAAAANDSGADLARQVESVASGLGLGYTSLSGAAATLGATVAFRPQIAALDALRTAPPGVLTAARTALGGQLTGAYNAPMAATAVAATPVVADFSAGGAPAVTAGPHPVQQTTTVAGDTGWQPGSADAGGPLPVDPGAPAAGERPVAPSGPTGPASTAEPGSSGPASAAGPTGPSAPSPTGPGGPSNPSSTGGPAAPPVPAGMPPATAPSLRATGVPIPEVVRPGAVRAGTVNPGRVPGLRPSTPTTTTAPTTSTSGGPASTTATGSSPTQSTPGSRAAQPPYGAAPTARRSSDEAGHRPADYLRSTAEGLLVLGPAPLVGPPVIGRLAGVEPDIAPMGDDAPDDDVHDDEDDDQVLDPTL